MNSLIEHILSLKNDKETLTNIWIGFEVLVYPDVLPQQYKPMWWDTYPSDYEAINESEKWDIKGHEGRKWGFGDPIQQYIETIIPKPELQTDLKVYLKEECGVILTTP